MGQISSKLVQSERCFAVISPPAIFFCFASIHFLLLAPTSLPYRCSIHSNLFRVNNSNYNHFSTQKYVVILNLLHMRISVLNTLHNVPPFLLLLLIIMSCRQHGYPWPSLATSPYHSSPPAGLLGYVLCLHIAAVCMFGLVVLLLLGHMWGSIGVRHLRARPCFSSSVRRVWLV